MDEMVVTEPLDLEVLLAEMVLLEKEENRALQGHEVVESPMSGGVEPLAPV